jgi:cytochrome bd-type quinol oxidase subunit 2
MGSIVDIAKIVLVACWLLVVIVGVTVLINLFRHKQEFRAHHKACSKGRVLAWCFAVVAFVVFGVATVVTMLVSKSEAGATLLNVVLIFVVGVVAVVSMVFAVVESVVVYTFAKKRKQSSGV